MTSKIIQFLRAKGQASSSQIHQNIISQGDDVSLVTVRRDLRLLVAKGVLKEEGRGRAVTYTLTVYGKLTEQVDAHSYCLIDPDTRIGRGAFDFNILPALNFNPFSDSQMAAMTDATKYYRSKIKDISPTLHQKELERFIIELSWKSSKIEGNTYTLLDTEKLIIESKEAPGHDHTEAQMILNHKKAFDYILAHNKHQRRITLAQIEDVHKLLVAGMGVTHNLRRKPVGVTGSKYRPLDNEYQIKEAVDVLLATVDKLSGGYAKALAILLGISYIQPFEDGNKRTARLMTNSVLLAHELAPLSYRSVSEEQYREATLVFYELNSLISFRDIFVAQYDFAARNYLVND
ncbi:MAG: Fic family protein [Candidatus Paceibacterota bacterium]|jgi:hypothetical protein